MMAMSDKKETKRNFGGAVLDKQREDTEMEIDLVRLILALWHKAWAIILAMLIGGGASFYMAQYRTVPTYQASALMYVNNGTLSVGGSSISLSDLTVSQSLVQTYIVILRTRLTLNDVIEEANLDYSYEQLRGMVSAEAVNETEIFSITVTSTDPQEAAMIANTITEVLPDKVAEIIDGASVRTVDFAVTPTSKSSPNVTRNTAMGMLVGAVISCGVIILMELLDDQIRNEDYLMQTYGMPILAAIPNLQSKPGKGYGEYRSQHSPSSNGGQK